MGIRLHTLAKELDTPSKDLVARCRERGIKVKSHLSSVPEPIAEVLRKEIVWRKERERIAAAQEAERRERERREAASRPAAPPRPSRPAPSGGRPPQREPGRPLQREPGRPARPQSGRPAPRPIGDRTRYQPRPPAPPRVVAEEPGSAAVEKDEGRRGRVKEKHKERDRAEVDRDKAARPAKKGRETKPAVNVEERVWRPPKREIGGARGRGRPRRRKGGAGGGAAVVERPSSVNIELPITVRELSVATGIKVEEIIRNLMLQGVMATINDTVSEEMLLSVSEEFSVEINTTRQKTLEEKALEEIHLPDRPEDLLARPAVVTFLGHVDHGKTSLLDRIRRTHVTEEEYGGITQHIGAYSVDVADKRVVFLDTPGHEAFTAMRARGANVTDVVVLVVAADDGVMPQTAEAINHARAANVPIVVALNKVDKPNANPDRVRQQLSEQNLVPHDWGGNTELVEVSAITGQGIEDLLEVLTLEADLLELKANPNKSAYGTVIEAHLSEGRGVVATVLVRDGTLHRGNFVVCGSAVGKVRAIYDDQGRPLQEAGPATPVEISGLDSVPQAGDVLQATSDAHRAKELAHQRYDRRREEALVKRKHVTLETLFSHLAEARVKEARVIIKADVMGSIEVLADSLNNLSTNEVRVNILHSAVGGVTESDVLLADASDAVIIAFHVVPEDRAKYLADEKGVEIRSYHVIYEVVSDVRKALEGLLEPEKKEVVVGHMNVTALFRSSKFGVILGGRVTDGRINRNDNIRLIRDSRVVFEGKLLSLRREKEDVREVQTGFECGLRLANYHDAKEGDVIETFVIEEIARKLS